MRNQEQETPTDSLVDEYPQIHVATITAVRKLYKGNPESEQLVREKLNGYVSSIAAQVAELRSEALQERYCLKFKEIDRDIVVAIMNRHADELEKKKRLAWSPDISKNFVLKELYDVQEEIQYKAALDHYRKLKEEGKVDFSSLNSTPGPISALWRKVKRIFV